MKRKPAYYYSKGLRRSFIVENEKYPFLSKICSIIEIQRFFRGYLARKHVSSALQRGKPPTRRAKLQFRMSTPPNILNISSDESEIGTFNEHDLILLQSIFRKKVDQIHLGRMVSYEKYPVYSSAVNLIISSYRKYRGKNALKYGKGRYKDREGRIRFYRKEDDAAAKIQRCWKRFMNKQVFRFYKELLKFKEIGNPSDVLRMINPAESKYLDRASGSHIRFRLGGRTFPPVIYYKIFIHGPVVDIGSFAPRDYTKVKQILPSQMFIKGEEPTQNYTQGRGWYRRVEGNNWRPINGGLIQMIEESEEEKVMDLTSARFMKGRVREVKTRRKAQKEEGRRFHFSKLVRKQDVMLKRKQRKIKWMRKMYKMAREGSIMEREGLSSPVGRGNSSNKGSNVLKKKVNETEIDELLQWSDALDFDSYVRDWQLIGVCANDVPDMHKLFLDGIDDEEEGEEEDEGEEDFQEILANPNHIEEDEDENSWT